LFGLAEHVSSILTPKEKKVDMFLKEIMNTISENEIIDDTAVVAADLTHQRRLDLVRKVMNDYSLVLSHKFEPILKLSLENDEAAAAAGNGEVRTGLIEEVHEHTALLPRQVLPQSKQNFHEFFRVPHAISRLVEADSVQQKYARVQFGC
jgi:hypothetical protein